MKKTTFKKRYVLGAGYPWANGTDPYFEVVLYPDQIVGKRIPLKFPSELWSLDVPKYRLVLERVR